jgi:hypothetical protein
MYTAAAATQAEQPDQQCEPRTGRRRRVHQQASDEIPNSRLER